jgi:hypothetical protein
MRKTAFMPDLKSSDGVPEVSLTAIQMSGEALLQAAKALQCGICNLLFDQGSEIRCLNPPSQGAAIHVDHWGQASACHQILMSPRTCATKLRFEIHPPRRMDAKLPYNTLLSNTNPLKSDSFQVSIEHDHWHQVAAKQ